MRLSALAVLTCITLTTLSGCSLPHADAEPAPGVATAEPHALGRWLIDRHEVRLERAATTSDAVSLSIRLAGQPLPVFETPHGADPLSLGVVDLTAHEKRGMASINTRVRAWCHEVRFTGNVANPASVTLDGQARCLDSLQYFTLTITRRAADAGNAIGIDIALKEGPANHIVLHAASHADEQVLGGGVQFGQTSLKGKRLPLVASEQGVGRGKQPLTFFANLTNDGAGGKWHSAYSGVPHVMTTALRSVFIDTHAYTQIDATPPDRLQFAVHASALRSTWRQAGSPLALIEAHTGEVGRMKALPSWMHRGAIIGMQGGTETVFKAKMTLEKAGAPVAGFWLQDWVGQRTTSFGKQLWWNWTLDSERYPRWNQLREDLAKNDIRLLGYANTFLVELEDSRRRSLFNEARIKGYLVKGADGQPLLSLNTSFSAAHVDLANPAAFEWMKQVLKVEMVAKGMSGWMADFAEGLPFDAIGSDGKPGGVALHNRWPELWAKLNRELIDETNPDAVAFHRSGWSRSPRYARLFWLGDQLVDWGPEDGLASALTGLLNGGLSGFAINHSDIGGYTTITSPVLDWTRSKELYLRWAEFAAFTPVFRTHEGNRPSVNWQYDSDAETLAHFTRMSKLFGCWRNTRTTLLQEVEAHGWPVNRMMWLHYPDQHAVLNNLPTQMMVGADILVAPVMTPGTSVVKVTIPEAGWVHLWSGHVAEKGTHAWAAPVGEPAVFVRAGTSAASELQACIKTL